MINLSVTNAGVGQIESNVPVTTLGSKPEKVYEETLDSIQEQAAKIIEAVQKCKSSPFNLSNHDGWRNINNDLLAVVNSMKKTLAISEEEPLPQSTVLPQFRPKFQNETSGLTSLLEPTKENMRQLEQQLIEPERKYQNEQWDSVGNTGNQLNASMSANPRIFHQKLPFPERQRIPEIKINYNLPLFCSPEG